jgi:hypothetical protein
MGAAREQLGANEKGEEGKREDGVHGVQAGWFTTMWEALSIAVPLLLGCHL